MSTTGATTARPVALVTGAGKGLGRASALQLADDGFHVIAVARTESDLGALAAERPGRIEMWAMDATASEFHERLCALPRLDALLNTVGSNRPQPFVDVDEAIMPNVHDELRGVHAPQVSDSKRGPGAR